MVKPPFIAGKVRQRSLILRLPSLSIYLIILFNNKSAFITDIGESGYKMF